VLFPSVQRVGAPTACTLSSPALFEGNIPARGKVQVVREQGYLLGFGIAMTYRIGEFAKLSGLSPKALRFYDQIGLLQPARVDQARTTACIGLSS
jgi:hypothetical protein